MGLGQHAGAILGAVRLSGLSIGVGFVNVGRGLKTVIFFGRNRTEYHESRTDGRIGFWGNANRPRRFDVRFWHRDHRDS